MAGYVGDRSKLTAPNWSNVEGKPAIITSSVSIPTTQSNPKFGNTLNLTLVANKETGAFYGQNFDGKTVFIYDPITKKITPGESTSDFQKINAKDLNNLVYNTKGDVLQTAELSLSTDKVEVLKKVPGYQSLGNSAKPGKAGDGAGPADPEKDNPAPTFSEDQQKIIQNIAKDYADNTRANYPGDMKSLRYPLNMNNTQDYVMFQFLEYLRTGILPQTGLRTTNSKINRKTLCSIAMAIPGGISDRNTVEWNSSAISLLNAGAASTLNSLFIGGADAATQAANKAVSDVMKDEDTLKAFAAAKLVEGTLTGANVLGRQFGAAENPNLELLFSSPSLRSFSFNFKMSPRSEAEAKTIRTIIRYFKQAMSVKRTKSILLLKSPHTFRIKYMNGNREHPYLNRIKECALTECVVNYTPDGTYMTYDDPEPSMTSYEMQLTFQELEPVFDDDYDDNKDNLPTNIGY